MSEITPDKLRPNPRNPRKISDKKLKMLKGSLSQFGDLSGIIFNRRTQTTNGGHQRLKILPNDPVIEKIWDTPTDKGTVAEGYIEFEGERFKYREVDWDEPTETAAMIAANNQGGENDMAGLSSLLLELDSFNIPMELTGFDSKEIEDIMTYAPDVPHPNAAIEDEIPEVKESFVKKGDLWILGNHRLKCGDASNKEDVAHLMGGERADMVYTDPPYGIDFDDEANSKKQLAHTGKISKKFGKIDGDCEEFDPAHILQTFGYANIFLWGANEYCWKLPRGAWIVWDKKLEQQANVPYGDFELCWSNNSGFKMLRHVWGGFKNKETGEARYHPTQKPVSLACDFFERWGKDKANIVDLYGGSGSTLIACEKTGKRCFMSEIDEHYASVIIERWQKFTGHKAIKEN